MFNNNGGYSLADFAAATGRNNNGAFGDGGYWWIIILFLIWGWGGNGFGNRGNEGFGMGVAPWATQADVRSAVDQQTLISKLDQQTYGLADSTYALNNTITSGFHGVDNQVCNLGYNMQSGFNNIASQIASCCCENGRALERGFADTNYNIATQACETRRAISDSTRDIIDNNNAGVRSILDFLTQDKIATLTAENQGLRLAASQEAQNTYLTSVLRPAPIPSYTVSAPWYATSGCGYCNG